MNIRIGQGYDVHRLVEGRKLILGGVEIPHSLGLDGHSDADVLLHAICDAILGALALGDIGVHFPPDDMQFKDADSRELLLNSYKLAKDKDYHLVNLDTTIAAQKPKLKPHIPAMRKEISRILDIEINQISIKATTTEKLGFEGREEGTSCSAICLMMKN